MNLLSEICSSVAETIATHPSFWTAPGVPVYSAWRADHLQKLATASAAFQACAVVAIQRCGAEEGQWGVLNPVVLRVYVAENLSLNRGAYRADGLALDVAGLLVAAEYPEAATAFEFAGITPVPLTEFPAALPDGAAVWCLAVDFSFAIRVPAGPAQTPAPTITEDGGTLTLAVSASPTFTTIRYTTDGTAPTTASPAYTTPLELPASGCLSARAYRAGEIASAVATWEG